jgi:ribosomal-protein-alanine N-acetyltransferase
MHADVTVQLATERHAAQIAEMSRDYIEHGLGWGWTTKRIVKAIRDPETNVGVVVEGGRVAGFGIMSYLETHAHLKLMAVCPASRRRGIASAILRWLESVAKVAGAERVLVECRRSNAPARTLYLEHGYNERNIEPGMYRGLEDGIHLEKWLRPPAAHSPLPIELGHPSTHLRRRPRH